MRHSPRRAPASRRVQERAPRSPLGEVPATSYASSSLSAEHFVQNDHDRPGAGRRIFDIGAQRSAFEFDFDIECPMKISAARPWQNSDQRLQAGSVCRAPLLSFRHIPPGGRTPAPASYHPRSNCSGADGARRLIAPVNYLFAGSPSSEVMKLLTFDGQPRRPACSHLSSRAARRYAPHVRGCH